MPEGELLGVLALTWAAALMLGLGGLLIYLGIGRQVEPVLLVPIGTGIILANIPLGGLTEPGGLLAILKKAGIDTELFPLLIFIGVGAMIDFGSLLERPYTVFLGAAAQFGIFGTFFLAYFLGDGGLRLFSLNGFHPRLRLSFPGRGGRRRRGGGGRLRRGRGGRQHFLHGGFRLDIDSPPGELGGQTGVLALPADRQR
jgi:hypothetical protein